ncbi:MAG TPA: cellulose binding domain-containing protein, partial [Actinoplanes sp.]|nr:cellulose binding domain-containing protein [Actinoplanes sp.]
MPILRKVAAGAAALLAGGAGPVFAAQARAAAGCQVTWTVTNQWQGGFGVNVDIRNLGDPITGWTLGFAFPGSQTISQLWNGAHTQSGAQVSVRDAGYNAAIATNGSTSFGFNGAGSAATPTAFTLNGTACTGGVPNPTTPPTDPPTTPPTDPPTTPPTTTPPAQNGRQMERLDRGLISVRSGSGNLVSWRWLAADPATVTFNVYRAGAKVNSAPVTTTTFLDAGAPAGAAYTVRAVHDGTEQAASPAALQFPTGFLDVPIQNPNDAAYAANDASVGDLDGDGRLDLVLKWEPLNAKDNSQSGVTDPVYVDAYTLTGARLWRIDLGRNIRAGAHYPQFQVYDYDGDGRAEVAMKTADGTTSGTGQVIGNASADHRNSSGYVLAGPEFLTVFDGR